MTLKETLKADLIAALKAHDKLRASVLRSVIGAVQSAEKSGKTPVEFDNDGVLQVIRKQIKQRSESAEIYRGAGYADRELQETEEMEVLLKYTPVNLTPDELEKVVIGVVRRFSEPTMKDFGQIMKAVVAEVDGKADGKAISEVVRSNLR